MLRSGLAAQTLSLPVFIKQWNLEMRVLTAPSPAVSALCVSVHAVLINLLNSYRAVRTAQ